uniref:(northern house mosquito) hypothetical protein n=1 Tax=Culex pipiens TaxID=7175 RepID=A0A8D8INV2_CULPI
MASSGTSPAASSSCWSCSSSSFWRRSCSISSSMLGVGEAMRTTLTEVSVVSFASRLCSVFWSTCTEPSLPTTITRFESILSRSSTTPPEEEPEDEVASTGPFPSSVVDESSRPLPPISCGSSRFRSRSSS